MTDENKKLLTTAEQKSAVMQKSGDAAEWRSAEQGRALAHVADDLDQQIFIGVDWDKKERGDIDLNISKEVREIYAGFPEEMDELKKVTSGLEAKSKICDEHELDACVDEHVISLATDTTIHPYPIALEMAEAITRDHSHLTLDVFERISTSLVVIRRTSPPSGPFKPATTMQLPASSSGSAGCLPPSSQDHFTRVRPFDDAS
jgi:hypothetical protein